jgi:hypothetical protein
MSAACCTPGGKTQKTGKQPVKINKTELVKTKNASCETPNWVLQEAFLPLLSWRLLCQNTSVKPIHGNVAIVG